MEDVSAEQHSYLTVFFEVVQAANAGCLETAGTTSESMAMAIKLCPALLEVDPAEVETC